MKTSEAGQMPPNVQPHAYSNSGQQSGCSQSTRSEICPGDALPPRATVITKRPATALPPPPIAYSSPAQRNRAPRPPLDPNNAFEAQLLDWRSAEVKAGNNRVVEAIAIIREVREAGETRLSLYEMPIRTLPECIGELTHLEALTLEHCGQLQCLPTV